MYFFKFFFLSASEGFKTETSWERGGADWKNTGHWCSSDRGGRQGPADKGEEMHSMLIYFGTLITWDSPM